MKPFLELTDVKKRYRMGGMDVSALAGISLRVARAELVVITGDSGAGKTTLLNLLGGMDSVSGGEIVVDGRRISGLNMRELARYRREAVGFVFQFYNLMPNLTALENVMLAQQISRMPQDALSVLGQVGLAARGNHYPAQLSGGEQQRVAVARALAKRPKLLLCDEPTGALDEATGRAVLALIRDACKAAGTTAVIVTHNAALAAMADRAVYLRSGKAVRVLVNEHPLALEQITW
ncbi:MAG TPA: ABC transporter ATP-binding protein [Candidatus Aphodomonas merdavium]|nr:ABC transporter ATP-binding protein [Candidatus Aphodomonas merdavium]